MALVEAVLALFLIGGVVVAPIYFIRNSRRSFLRTLAPAAAESLTRLVAPLFDARPETRTEEEAAAAVLEGRRGGEPIELRMSYASNDGYVNTGYDSYIGAALEVTVGLRGATPKLSLVATKEVLASFFEQRFEANMNADLLDDESKQAIMAWVARVPSARKIAVTPKGLTIEIPAATTPTQETKKDIELTLALAEHLRGRILSVLEKRATAHVRVDAYREASTGEPRLRADDEDDDAAATKPANR